MQVSVETTSSIERRMTIGIPADQIEKEVEQRLQQAAKTVRINGFRPGKVPAKVVKKRYGNSVRQEVVSEVMRNSYMEAIGQEGIAPIGYPKFEPKTVEEGKDLEFIAVIEVAPEIEKVDVSGLKLEQPVAEIKDKDVKNMIETLRRQYGTQKSVKRKSKKKDILTIDFKGYVDGEAFEGGSATDQKLILGSGKMIPGFEDGLIGAKAGESVELNVTFPEEYGNADLAGKEAKFDVDVKIVEDTVLPEMDEAFFTKYGVSATTEEEFVAEVTANMERELKQAVGASVKQQIVAQLSEHNDVDVPESMIEEETNKMKQEAIQQYGAGQDLDLSQLPSELFKDQAESRVKTGLLFAAIIKGNELKADQEKVDEKIQEIASTYESPDEVLALYDKPEHRSQVEAFVLEEQVVDFVLSQVKVKNKKMSYEDAVKAASPRQ
jgi:trigger factor